MAGLRLILGVDVTAGNESNASHSLPGLLRCIDRLPKDKLPKQVRGDCGFGTDLVMQGLDARGIPYLFNLRLSKSIWFLVCEHIAKFVTGFRINRRATAQHATRRTADDDVIECADSFSHHGMSELC